MSTIIYQPKLNATIHKSIRFSASSASDLRLKSIDYFTQSNFRMVSALADKQISFRRGSLLSNMYTFNPLKWKSEIQIDIQGQEVSVQVKINTFAQLPSVKEEALWDEFLQNFEAYVNDGRVDHLSKNEASLKSVKKSSYRRLGWVLVGALVAGIPAVLLALWTGIDTIAPVGASMGAMYYLNKKNEQERKQASQP
ncbi:MAG: hypothetical protein Q8J69_00885 [Sphingobacteriaceae bacterium]|nr:hypothetical protein [Sphingobacteriaceae bacterium]